MANVFISYAREDERQALEISQSLVQAGFSVWMDKQNLLPGQDWKIEIEKAIRGSSVFLACLSRSSVSKTGFVQAELRRALEVAEMMPEGQIFIIPLRLDDCQVPYKLQHLQWVDYFQLEGRDRILQGIATKIKPATSQPAASHPVGPISQRQPSEGALPVKAALSQPELRRMMDDRYDLESLRVLCLDLDVRYENLRGEGISARIVSLIEYCRRHNKYDDLLSRVTTADW
jgi:hypothetical protein